MPLRCHLFFRHAAATYLCHADYGHYAALLPFAVAVAAAADAASRLRAATP